MAFDSKARLEYLGDDLWKTCAPLSYTTQAGKTWICPKGFVTDLGTIPRILWPFLAPFEIARPAMIHDQLYMLVADGQLRRKYADQVLREACLCEGKPHWKAMIIYLSVRVFGQFHVGKSSHSQHI